MSAPEPGLCARCVHGKRVAVPRRDTVYWRCDAKGLPKYPSLPVLRCAAHTPAKG